MKVPHTIAEKQAVTLGLASLTEPSIVDMAINLTTSMGEWAKAGFKIADDVQSRAGKCLHCERWDPAARLGLGKCRICGCSKFKWWLKTTRCPIHKW